MPWYNGVSNHPGGYAMRRLFDLDRGDHAGCAREFVRNSARAIILREGRVAMVHSLKYDYYKFPGGGIEPGEAPTDALVRETLEETGLTIVPGSIREYGCAHRVQRSSLDPEERFVQDNFYYLCAVEAGVAAQRLDEYEAEEAFTLEYVRPETAIAANRRPAPLGCDQAMWEREARVLELLVREGLLD